MEEQLATKLAEAQARIAELENILSERQQHEKNLRQRSSQLQIVTQVNRITSSILNIDELIKQSVNLIRDWFGLYYVGLFLVDDAREHAALRAGTGEAGAAMMAAGHRLKVGGASMIGQCIATGEARIALDVGEEAVRFENPHLPDTHSEMALPLRSRDWVMGALSMQSVKVAAFDEESITISQMLADNLATAIDNADLYTSLQEELLDRERAELERERLQKEVIAAQQRAIQELSTPIIPVLDGIIVMPLIGSVDSLRAKDIMRGLLAGINAYHAKIVILDITGVPIVDSGVAGHLNKTIKAARLKGAHTIVTGISEAVAETVVDLGIDWSDINTLTDLQTGLLFALGKLGFTLQRRRNGNES
ncbi:MAG TPA: GAF domain-containing protein [Anaerolineae bacterium]|nr:GAF domain-containing protein [Anaerolineae bacterium]